MRIETGRAFSYGNIIVLKKIIKDYLRRRPELVSALRGVARQGDSLCLEGLVGGGKVFAIGLAAAAGLKKMAVVCPDIDSALALVGELGAYDLGETRLIMPRRQTVPGSQPNAEEREELILGLHALADGAAGVVVMPLESLRLACPPAAELRRAVILLEKGGGFEFEDLLRRLDDYGYRREKVVSEAGEYCVHGGIVDVFPPGLSWPLRLEFWGDKLESLRTFDPASQRSRGRLKRARILPFAIGGKVKLLDYLRGWTLVLEEPSRLNGEAGWSPLLARATAKAAKGLLCLSRGRREGSDVPCIDLGLKSGDHYRGRFENLRDELKAWKERDGAVYLLCENEGEEKRLRELLLEGGAAAAANVGQAAISEGLVDEHAGMVILPYRQLFDRYRWRRSYLPRRKVHGGGPRLTDIEQVAAGDAVVHPHYGIGRYAGIETIESGEGRGDYIVVSYAEGETLYLPVARLNLLQRYVGGDKPRIYPLRGDAWEKVKARTKRSIRDMAKQLLKLYARRSNTRGHAFRADSVWQKEFEEAFPYQETPDQLRACREVKADMESRRPMDRLICGDVGFGKTEVAMRAAFKAVREGKQVAVLAPTTVLVEQHLRTFRERLADYPIVTESLSRFRRRKEQKDILARLAGGEVDIIVGTHRLLGKDVVFKDLGLLVIDEEHRFGVTHKERLKEMRCDVDVIAMTATPIPRTLNMSLLGIRDLSLIETPPRQRRAVETYVVREEDGLLRDAVLREMARGGQVFFLHNRVRSIAAKADHLARILPEARLAVAHGQMPSSHLEAVMYRFYMGEYDVLVTTNIIESGLDLPQVNTIIISNAWQFGLAQLYQLRGRVGRADRQAYAYLCVRSPELLSDEARKRLEVIEECSRLGSGLQVAMRDLELRGSGNLLGAEQHGYIDTVGYQMYCRLLREVGLELRGEEPLVEKEPVEVELPLEAYLEHHYIDDDSLRLRCYRRLAACGTGKELADIGRELVDRFGPLPPAGENLLAVVGLKIRAARSGVRRLRLARGYLYLEFCSARERSGCLMARLRQRFGRDFEVAKPGAVRIKVSSWPQTEIVDRIEKIIGS